LCALRQAQCNSPDRDAPCLGLIFDLYILPLRSLPSRLFLHPRERDSKSIARCAPGELDWYQVRNAALSSRSSTFTLRLTGRFIDSTFMFCADDDANGRNRREHFAVETDLNARFRCEKAISSHIYLYVAVKQRECQCPKLRYSPAMVHLRQYLPFRRDE
jgi:hypothetical protein